MAFRVLITGGRHFTDYPTLRATLDALLANRLPDVELLTTGGRGVPMLAASYAAAKGLAVTALVPDFTRFPVDAVERRDAFLVSQADAAVLVWDSREPSVRRLLELVERRGIPVHVIGAPAKKPTAVRRIRDPEPPTRRGAGPRRIARHTIAATSPLATTRAGACATSRVNRSSQFPEPGNPSRALHRLNPVPFPLTEECNDEEVPVRGAGRKRVRSGHNRRGEE